MHRPIYGKSPELTAVLNAASLIAATDVTVLLRGESGTGKELLAHSIRDSSPRNGGPFVAVNCASLTNELADSALYGHRRGAFTGAVENHRGFIREAEGGTLLLDEIGEMPLPIQAKFLRFLETGEYQPVGSSRAAQADVRIIAATNRDLAEEVDKGNFRADLYYRLNVVPLELPPLRNRNGDLELLLNNLTRDLSERYHLEAPSYDPVAVAAMQAYGWPGNVRELHNLCERLTILCSGRRVGLEQLPPEVLRGPKPTDAGNFTLPGEGVRLEEVETLLIRQALERTAGNRSRAARLLGLTRDTLLYRLKKYSLTDYALGG